MDRNDNWVNRSRGQLRRPRHCRGRVLDKSTPVSDFLHSWSIGSKYLEKERMEHAPLTVIVSRVVMRRDQCRSIVVETDSIVRTGSLSVRWLTLDCAWTSHPSWKILDVTGYTEIGGTYADVCNCIACVYAVFCATECMWIYIIVVYEIELISDSVFRFQICFCFLGVWFVLPKHYSAVTWYTHCLWFRRISDWLPCWKIWE